METNKSLSPLQATAIGLLLISCFQSCTSHPNPIKSHRKFAGLFIFGTSVIDNGNNNYLVGTLAKVNYTPYGIDFPFGPTGRYSNGENVADVLGHLIGLPLIPAFLNPITKGAQILRGVNYGSGGSGILDSTGSRLGGVINMNQQINNFVNVTLPELENLNRKEMITRSLYMVATGNNDIFAYFLNPGNVTLEAFVDGLMSTFSSQFKKLYGVGARDFVVVSVYPVGCSPWITAFTNTTGRCYAPLNAAAQLFHARLLNLVHEHLKPNLPGSEFVVVNTYDIIIDVINDPIPRGFKNVSSACCELTKIQSFAVSCKEGGKVCRNRNKFVYFDGQHNTQAINVILATKAFRSSNTSQVYPFNVKKLAYRL